MFEIELVYAHSPAHQRMYTITVPYGCTVKQALELSSVLTDYPEISMMANGATDYSVGIWYKTVELSHLLKPGDRVEIYRALTLSAMDARKVRSKSQVKPNNNNLEKIPKPSRLQNE